MKDKYYPIGNSKVISSYGGVGSLIETADGFSLLITDFDGWVYYTYRECKNWELKDDRLLKRLKFEKSFPKIKGLFSVPYCESSLRNPYFPKEKQKTISAKLFPEWFFCKNCKKLKKLNEWYKLATENREKFDLDCGSCKQKNRKVKVSLEQVSLVTISNKAEIKDFDWQEWINCSCEVHQLKYFKRGNSLESIKVSCDNCREGKTLARIFMQDKKNSTVEKFKNVEKTSNSVYYPIILKSLLLPVESEFVNNDESKSIKKAYEKLQSLEDVGEIFSGYSKDKIKEICLGEEDESFEGELSYRLKEYKFLKSNSLYPNPGDGNEDISFQKTVTEESSLGIERVVAIDKLKMTVVQTGYTRQEPFSCDQFLEKGTESHSEIKAKYTSTKGKGIDYLPAIRQRGEGIFISLNINKLNDWLEDFLKNNKFAEKIDKLDKNIASSQHKNIREKFKDKKHIAKFVLIHTLSHILMKELEFYCGYPTPSLNERLFVDNEEMVGFLIYTLAGSEGSNGGLVSQAQEDSFKKLF